VGRLEPAANSFCSLGVAFSKLGEWEEAVLPLERSVSLYDRLGQPQPAAKSFFRLAAYESAGEFEKSVQYYNFSLEREGSGPERVHYLSHFAGVYFSMGRHELATKSFFSRGRRSGTVASWRQRCGSSNEYQGIMATPPRCQQPTGSCRRSTMSWAGRSWPNNTGNWCSRRGMGPLLVTGPLDAPGQPPVSLIMTAEVWAGIAGSVLHHRGDIPHCGGALHRQFHPRIPSATLSHAISSLPQAWTAASARRQVIPKEPPGFPNRR